MIPDCTLVTACYDLTKYKASCRSPMESIQSIKDLLHIRCYLVIYTDEIMINHIREVRKKYENITKYIVGPIESLKNADWILDKIRKNREIYHPTKDDRTSAESHFICCNKFQFVLDTIYSNPFGTSKYGWIDSNLGDNLSKICINYKSNMLLNVLTKCSQNFHIQVLNTTNKKFAKSEHLHEYYSEYRWVACGCLFITGRDVGVSILQFLYQHFIDTTNAGYGHGEEMLYLKLFENKELSKKVVKSYGDYSNILNNFIRTTEGFWYIYKNVICNYIHYGYMQDCFECCMKLVDDMESYDSEMKPDHCECYFIALFIGYICAYYVDRTKAIQLANKIHLYIDITPEIKFEYMKRESYHKERLAYAFIETKDGPYL
jgi:hypothetical protein